MTDNELSALILKCAYKVHSVLGPGLLESAYAACLKQELKKAGLSVKSEVPIPVVYDSIKLECGYRIDLLVEDKFVVELKSMDGILPIHLAQTITYLRLGGYNSGLLINFNVESLKNGIRRVFANIEKS